MEIYIPHARPRETIHCTGSQSFLEPVPPPQGAPIDTVIAYMRARNEYNDRISAAFCAEFDRSFRKALRRRS